MGALTPLTRDDVLVRDASGAIVRYQGITAFSAFIDWMRGDQQMVADFYGWAKGFGVNTVRVFFIWANYGFTPKEYDYADVRAFIEWTNAQGLMVHVVRFCDQNPNDDWQRPVVLTPAEQDAHFAGMTQAVAGLSVWDEYMNEGWQNGIDLVRRLPDLGGFSARSSHADNEYPDAPGPMMKWGTIHTPRGFDQSRKVKSLLDVSVLGFGGEGNFPRKWEPARLPMIAGEPPHIAKDAWENTSYVADYFALAHLYGNGACIHGGWAPDGDRSDFQRCNLPTDPLVLEQMAAIQQTWQANIPIDIVQAGRYVRGDINDTGELGIRHRDRYGDDPLVDPVGGCSRTFAMKIGNRQIIAPIERADKWEDAFAADGLRNGYRLIDRQGYRGNVITVEQ